MPKLGIHDFSLRSGMGQQYSTFYNYIFVSPHFKYLVQGLIKFVQKYGPRVQGPRRIYFPIRPRAQLQVEICHQEGKALNIRCERINLEAVSLLHYL